MATKHHTKDAPAPVSRLFNSGPLDTIHHCAAVIDMMTAVNQEEASGESAEFGSFLILSDVATALRHASATLEPLHAEGSGHDAGTPPAARIDDDSTPPARKAASAEFKGALVLPEKAGEDIYQLLCGIRAIAAFLAQSDHPASTDPDVLHQVYGLDALARQLHEILDRVNELPANVLAVAEEATSASPCRHDGGVE